MSRRLRVNPIRCTAHGLCAELLPEHITLDDWGYPIVDDRDVPPALLAHAKRAVAACPTLALVLERREATAQASSAMRRRSSKRGGEG